MSAINAYHQPSGRLAFGSAAGLVLLTLLLAAGQGRAQRYVPQDGRLFDANPQIGGSRYNYTYGRPVSPLVGGNPYATGNIGRGLSLRSFSPISSPTWFRASLGSQTLSNFRRDSISVADQAAPLGGLIGRPFFDPSQTAPTASYLRGFYDVPARLDYRVPDLRSPSARTAPPVSPSASVPLYGSPPRRGLDDALSRQAQSDYLTTPLNTELHSTIFGLQQPRLPGPLSEAQLPSYLTSLPGVGEEEETGTEQARTYAEWYEGPLDLRIWPERQTPLSAPSLADLMRENAGRVLTESILPELPKPGESRDVTPPGLRPEETYAAGALPGPPTLRDASMLPGHDVFTDMRLALELSLNPQAEWFHQMLSAARRDPGKVSTEDPTLALETQTQAALAAEEFLTQMLETPITTFARDGDAVINKELQQAEAAMDLGNYYDAVRHYERARLLDPVNPLPLVGKGHALLAAGEYVSAAVSLINGLGRFPELADFQVDLPALMGGGEIVDIRRADLMKQLARNEDPQLRFLLGYLEFNSGLVELGLENLDRAARDAGPGTLIRRYPDLIRSSRKMKLMTLPELSPEQLQELEGSPPETSGRDPLWPGEERE